LARAHLVHVFNASLGQPPTFGKSVIESAVKDVESIFFPTDVDRIEKYLKDNLLGRTRGALERNWLILVVKKITLENRRGRWRQVLAATVRLLKDNPADLLRDKFGEILKRLDDTTLPNRVGWRL
jgi:hypothetical protein